MAVVKVSVSMSWILSDFLNRNPAIVLLIWTSLNLDLELRDEA